MQNKRNSQEAIAEDHSPKKFKKSADKPSKFQKKTNKFDGQTKPRKFDGQKTPGKFDGQNKSNKFDGQKYPGKFDGHKNPSKFDGQKKSFDKNFDPDGKPPDWNEFKKKKKEEQKKRKEGKNSYDLVVQAKKIGEKLRLKTLKGGDEERKKLTNELHEILAGNYPKLVLTHDMARIIQYLLKFGSPKVRKDISEELKTVIFEMLQSKYAKYCVKRMLKYGDTETRASIIKACYGHAVKLASHAVSAAIFDFGFSTWATTEQKHHLLQEFYSDMYKQSKDDSVKHLRDVYLKSPEMKIATLSAVKGNLQRILNKTLLDSHLIQIILHQFLQECNQEDRNELMAQLAPHAVVLANSKEGARVVMSILWNGTNKDRKHAIKALKEHALDLAKHEHAHCTIITAMDALDDTKLTTKILLIDLMKKASELAGDEWGRKVLLWLVAPADTAHFHPTFIQELNEGRQNSSCKKDVHVRRKELLTALQDSLLEQICAEPTKWVASSSVAIVTLAILKAVDAESLAKTHEALAKVITDVDFTIKEGEKEICGIEHAGLHMTLKKLISHDKNKEKAQFGEAIVEQLNENIVEKWLQINRGCFLLVLILESDSEEVQNKLKELLEPHKSIIKKQSTTGAKILLKKLN